jgi:hypothetical protein
MPNGRRLTTTHAALLKRMKELDEKEEYPDPPLFFTTLDGQVAYSAPKFLVRLEYPIPKTPIGMAVHNLSCYLWKWEA